MGNKPDKLLPASLIEALTQIAAQPKRQYSQQEIDEARGNFSLMHDRVFAATFINSKNNDMLTNWVNAMRKIHGLGDIPPITHSKVQQLSLYDILGRGMVGDLFGEAYRLNVTVEAQRKPQEDFAIRGTLASSNAMHHQFNQGDDFAEAPNVIGVNLCGFKVPELAKNPMFCARVARFDVDTKEPFLIDRYSDYYIQFPKMRGVKKKDLPEQYHELWDMCLLIKAKVKDYEKVIKMNSIANPSALEIAERVREVVTPSSFVNETLGHKDWMEQLWEYAEFLQRDLDKNRVNLEESKRDFEQNMNDFEQSKRDFEQNMNDFEQSKKDVEQGKKDVEQGKKDVEQSKKDVEQREAQLQKNAEKMIIMALQDNISPPLIESMRKTAGITESRLDELKAQTKTT